jgi:uncharacterized protein YidB (DUF937 family)
MGLLDSVIGAVSQAAGQGGGGQGDLLHLVVGMIGPGGAGGGLGGGLGGLVQQFEQGGLGHLMQSWIGTGQNLPISAEQLGSVLGSDTVQHMAAQLGMAHGDVLGQLTQLLPQVVDKITPNGQLPEAGTAGGGLGDLASMLGSLLKG